MKAITTKILHATDTRPTRIKASAEGVVSLTSSLGLLESALIERGERVTEETLHREAALRLCRRFGWGESLASGGTAEPGVWVHCFVPVSDSAKLALAVESLLPYAKDILDDPEALACFDKGVVERHVRQAEAALAGVPGTDTKSLISTLLGGAPVSGYGPDDRVAIHTNGATLDRLKAAVA